MTQPVSPRSSPPSYTRSQFTLRAIVVGLTLASIGFAGFHSLGFAGMIVSTFWGAAGLMSIRWMRSAVARREAGWMAATAFAAGMLVLAVLALSLLFIFA